LPNPDHRGVFVLVSASVSPLFARHCFEVAEAIISRARIAIRLELISRYLQLRHLYTLLEFELSI
jgi:hypothetical protein